MKNFKKLLVMCACLALLVSVGDFDNDSEEPIQTWGLAHWVTGVQ